MLQLLVLRLFRVRARSRVVDSICLISKVSIRVSARHRVKVRARVVIRVRLNLGLKLVAEPGIGLPMKLG